MSVVSTDWRTTLDERMRKEVALAEHYVSFFGHGTSGHLAYTVIERLAHLLDEAVHQDVPHPPSGDSSS